MKRDMDLIRSILLMIDDHEGDPTQPMSPPPGLTAEEDTRFSYHVMLLYQAGFIEAVDSSSSHGLEWSPRHLTWQGHELLAAIRNRELWHRSKAAAKEAGSEALSSIWDVAKALSKEQLKKRTGLEV